MCLGGKYFERQQFLCITLSGNYYLSGVFVLHCWAAFHCQASGEYDIIVWCTAFSNYQSASVHDNEPITSMDGTHTYG